MEATACPPLGKSFSHGARSIYPIGYSGTSRKSGPSVANGIISGTSPIAARRDRRPRRERVASDNRSPHGTADAHALRVRGGEFEKCARRHKDTLRARNWQAYYHLLCCKPNAC